MKTVLKILSIAGLMIVFTGCYTELATIERDDQIVSYDSDTLYDAGTTTINNHYYLDDEYRQSRLRLSFNYYYPSYSSRISAYYYSYFDDNYWGMYHRPSWYYDPWYSYNPYYGWCYYPAPVYYNPWNSYYPYYGYYQPYYSSPVYANTSSNASRPRTGGATRDPVPENRPRTNPMTPPSAGPAVTEGASAESRPVDAPRSGRENETPWWERIASERPTRNTDGEARPVGDESKPVRDTRAETPRGTNDRTPSGEARPAGRSGDDRPVNRPKSNDRPVRDDRPVQRPKPRTPAVTPPAKESPARGEARQAERPRESRQPSYTPPRQSTPPQAAPPRSSGSSSSNGNNGRKRD